MNIEIIKKELKEKGYCIIPNILDPIEVLEAKKLFMDWKNTIPNHDKLHKIIDPHGIYKFHEVGHQRHAWYIRTNEKVKSIYKQLWGCNKLIVSFDGSCYIPKSENRTDNIWTHTDQAPNSIGLKCYQGFIALTDNKERTLRVFEGSHLLHEKYFKDRNIISTKNWQLIEHEYLKEIESTKKKLEISAGSLVLWDSRTFHQNQYGKPNSEERIVQYVCYLPDNHKKNSNSMKAKRLKYFNERRTTSHWPCPINVNSKQPQTYGDSSRLIDYSKLIKPNIDDLNSKIMDLL